MTQVASTLQNGSWSMKMAHIDSSTQSTESKTSDDTARKAHKYLDDGLKIIGQFVEENYTKMEDNSKVDLLALLKKDFQFLLKVNQGWQKLVRETLRILQPDLPIETGVLKFKPFTSFVKISQELQKQSSMVFELQIQNESFREELIENEKKIKILQRKSKMSEPLKSSWGTAPKKPMNFDDVSTPFPRGLIPKGSLRELSSIEMSRPALEQQIKRLHEALHKLHRQYQGLKLINEQKSYTKPVSRCEARDLDNGRKVRWDVQKVHQETDLPVESSPFVKRHYLRKTLRYPMNNLSLPHLKAYHTPKKARFAQQ